MFDEEEQEILAAFETGHFQTSINADEEIALAKQAAKEHLRKSKNITLSLNLADVTAIKRKAKETGIPYQTLISSVIHQFASGRLKVEI